MELWLTATVPLVFIEKSAFDVKYAFFLYNFNPDFLALINIQ
jgi:hypothetical protein